MSGARRTRVLRLATAGPQDTAPLAAAIKAGEVDPATIVAIVGKTEGNGCVNDFTRGYATLSLKLLLAESLKCAPSEIDKRVAIVMSGGTEGGLSPHLLVFCREPATVPASGPRLAIGVGPAYPLEYRFGFLIRHAEDLSEAQRLGRAGKEEVL